MLHTSGSKFDLKSSGDDFLLEAYLKKLAGFCCAYEFG